MLPSGAVPHVERPSGVFYPLVPLGLFAYASTAFRLTVVGARGDHPERGTLYVAAHRAETDVPAICGGMYVASRAWARGRARLYFAARDDLFEPGFFGGFPPGLSPRTRRLLFPIGIGRYLPRVHVRPIRSATAMRLVQALSGLAPDSRLADSLPGHLLEQLERRSEDLALPRPKTARDVLRGHYADILWRQVDVDVLSSEAFATVWQRRAAAATADLRGLVELLQAGEPLMVFPEGRPSPDGGVGPVQRGLGALIRRGRPDRVRAFAIGYDDLTVRRSRIYVGAAAPVRLHGRDVEPAVERYLARTLPLTVAQVLAPRLLAAAVAGETTLPPATLLRCLEAEIEAAVAAGRPLDPRLTARTGRLALLDEGLCAAERRGAVRHVSRSEIEPIAGSILGDPLLARYGREHASVAAALEADTLPG